MRMLGFGKKKKKEADGDASPAEAPDKKEAAAKKKGKAVKDKEPPAVSAAAQKAAVPPPKKKRITIKKLIFAVVILGILGGGGYAGYVFFLQKKAPAQRQYRQTAMPHLTLPPEMLKFTFNRFPDLYDSFLAYENEMSLLENEIARIEAIAEKYPDQQKIADRQKKIWEKGKNTLLKEFAKIEKPVKETFVLFQVNPTQGQAQIESLTKDLTASAQAAVDSAQQLSAEIRAAAPKPPKGMIRSTLYKLKKKFL